MRAGRSRAEEGEAPGPEISDAVFRRCLGIVATLDAEPLGDLILSTLAQATGAQGAALWVAGEQGTLRLAAHRGVVEPDALPGVLDPGDAHLARGLRSGTPFDAPGWPEDEAIQVPLLVGDEVAGVALLVRRAAGRFGAPEHASAAAVGGFAAVALANARRFQAAERRALLDRETGTYNLPYFVDHVAKEFHKARRYGRQFSLGLVAVDNLEQARREAPRELFRAGMRALAGAIGRAAREADVLARADENEFQVLLPETDHFGARTFLRRATEEIARDPAVQALEHRVPLLLSMGIATYPRDGEDQDALAERCRARVEEQRGSLVRRLHLGDLPPGAFWELVDLLLSDGARLPESSPSARRRADPAFFEAVQREAARELGRDRRARGVLYLASSSSAGASSLLEGLPEGQGASRAGDDPARVFVLGPRSAGASAPHPLVSRVHVEGDPRITSHDLLFFLGESAAYALLQRPDGVLFHTSDAPLVDLLVAKLQGAYELQPI
jgi:two-component system, cell cycle response regulator